MTEPLVTIKSITTDKISDEKDKGISVVTFSFDKPVHAFSVNVIGTSPDSGIVAESAKKDISDLGGIKIVDYKSKSVLDAKNDTIVDLRATYVSELKTLTIGDLRVLKEANTDIDAEIDWTELYQEGDNQVNIYGRGLDGKWTPYMSN